MEKIIKIISGKKHLDNPLYLNSENLSPYLYSSPKQVLRKK